MQIIFTFQFNYIRYYRILDFTCFNKNLYMFFLYIEKSSIDIIEMNLNTISIDRKVVFV